MKRILKKDIDKLMNDTKKVKQEIEVLEQDHAICATDQEDKDLMDILDDVKGLEVDVSVMMGDCFFLSQEKKNIGVKGDLHQAYKNLTILFKDLKKMREEITTSYVVKRELEQLEIDLMRFRKTVMQIKEDLEKY